MRFIRSTASPSCEITRSLAAPVLALNSCHHHAHSCASSSHRRAWRLALHALGLGSDGLDIFFRDILQ